MSLLTNEQFWMLCIFSLAALLWLTELIPLFATAFLIIALEVLILSNPGHWSIFVFDNGNNPTLHDVLAGAVSPILVLFLGGFCLARVAQNTDVDKTIAAFIVRISRSHPTLLILNIMLVTACFSMWMSNTATTAMMIAVIMPLLNSLDAQQNSYKKALLLSIPFAANIGGMGTPIGSPPNAVAVGFLSQHGYPVSFLQWMMIAIPIVGILLLITWRILLRQYKLKIPVFYTSIPVSPLNRQKLFVMAIFALTVTLWLTDTLHGLHSSLIALIPIIIFSITGQLSRKDINQLSWDSLILISGGLALGSGFVMTGFDTVFSHWLTSGLTHPSFLVIPFIITTFALSSFMSNTAATNLILPIGIAFSMQFSELMPAAIYQMAINIALSASVAMALPVSTPPNQIAYAEGNLTTRDFVLPGITIGIIGLLLIISLGNWLLTYLPVVNPHN